jgi:glucose-1-phosphate cytidylyltransferase
MQTALIDTALILCGGRGTRLMEKTGDMPKPMLPINGIPMLVHIMWHYMKHGVTNFILPVGYLGEYFYFFFNNYAKPLEIGLTHATYEFQDCRVVVIDTGEETLTGGRVFLSIPFLPPEFYLTYGDGISTVDVTQSARMLKNYDKIDCVITAVNPPARFGALEIDMYNYVTSFTEKPTTESLINGGFMAVRKSMLNDYFDLFEDIRQVNLEKHLLPILSSKGKVMAVRHYGYWQCVDTLRDYEQIQKDCRDGKFILEG